MAELDPALRDLALGANFAVLSVILRSGRPMTHVMWVDADAEHVLVNTEVHRAKFRAVSRDPRVTVTVWDRDDPYTYAEVRGTVAETVRGRRPAPTSTGSRRSTGDATTTRRGSPPNGSCFASRPRPCTCTSGRPDASGAESRLGRGAHGGSSTPTADAPSPSV